MYVYIALTATCIDDMWSCCSYEKWARWYVFPFRAYASVVFLNFTVHSHRGKLFLSKSLIYRYFFISITFYKLEKFDLGLIA